MASTLVAAAAALIVVALTRNAARVRYWLWLAASVKFLVPFAVLTALGRRAGWFTPTPVAPADLTQVIEAVSQPFSVSGLAVIAPGRAVESAGVGAVDVIAAIWVTGCLMLLATWLPVTALQEQHGLKLDARRATVQVMAIDAIERPTEN